MSSKNSFFKNFDSRFDTETIEQFLYFLGSSVRGRVNSIKSVYDSLSEDQFEDTEDIDSYRMHLDDKYYFLYEVKKLGEQLTIVALYKQVELHIKRVTKRNFPDVKENELFNISALKKALPFSIETMHGFAAYNELRLINNAIKHVGKVSQELASSFPVWVVGEEFKDLGAAYERILPDLKNFIKEFVGNSYLNSKRY